MSIPEFLSDGTTFETTAVSTGVLRQLLKEVPAYPLLAGEVGAVNLSYPHGDIRRFGAAGGTDSTSAFQAWAASTDGFKRVVPPAASAYTITAQITLPSNIEIEIQEGATIQMGTRLNALFQATNQSNIHIYGKGKVKGTGTSYPVDVSRLFYFTGCSDVSLVGPELSLSVWGAHFETCTDWDFDCTVRDISDTVDGSQGYGILASLDNLDFRIAGKFYNIGRHAIYISAGSSNGVVDDVIVDGCYNTGVTCNCFNTQNRIKNIVWGNVVLKNVGIAGDVNGCSGLSVFGNCENITITSGVVIETVGTDGIHIEGNSTYTPATNPVGITIDSPSINSCSANGLVIINAANVTVVKPRIRNVVATAIIITTTGVGTGSFTDSVDLGSYDIDGAGTGITINNVTNTTLGFGQMRHVTGLKFNVPTTNINNIRYVGPQIEYDFYEIDLAASQTNNLFVANPVGAYWASSEAGYVTELFGLLSAAPTAGTLTISFNSAGTPSTILKVDIAVGQTAFAIKLAPGIVPFGAGGKLQVSYTTDAGFLPAGSIDVVCQVRFAPFPAAT